MCVFLCVSVGVCVCVCVCVTKVLDICIKTYTHMPSFQLCLLLLFFPFLQRPCTFYYFMTGLFFVGWGGRSFFWTVAICCFPNGFMIGAPVCVCVCVCVCVRVCLPTAL